MVSQWPSVPRPGASGLLSLTLSHRVSRGSAPPRPHGPNIECRFPWSGRFDRIFRNEGVMGSNPPSSTESPGRVIFRSPFGLLDGRS